MKKIFIYFLILIFICFAIPIIFTQEFSKKTYSQNVENSNYIVDADYVVMALGASPEPFGPAIGRSTP